MSFDWGGFTGGIIGVIGAYGAARYSFKKQQESNEPFKHRKTYDLTINIRNIYETHFWAMNNTGRIENFEELFKVAIDFKFELQKIIPEAIELDRSLVSSLTDSIHQIAHIHMTHLVLERNMDNFINCKNELSNLIHLKQEECDNRINEILRAHLS